MTSSKGFFLSRHVRALCGITFVLITAFGLVYAFHLVRVATLLRCRRVEPLPLAVYDHFFGYQSTVQDITIPGGQGPIQMRVYTPVGARNPAPVLLVHGFAPVGDRDSYLNALAYSLARIGYLVVIPTIPAETHYEMRASDLPVIGDAIRWTAHDAGQRVSVFGISFGGGLGIAAASQPGVVQDVKLIVCLSGYNNLASIAHYYIRDRVLDPYGHPYVGHAPGPMIIVAPYLSELVPPKDFLALHAVIEEIKLNHGRMLPADDPALAKLTDAQRKEFFELESVDSVQMRDRYRASIDRHSAEIAAISPSSVLGHLQVPLYVLHGSDDPEFPEGEIEWMRQETAGKTNVHILVTPWITHAFFQNQVSVWKKLQVLNFCVGLFRAMSHKQALSSPAPQ